MTIDATRRAIVAIPGMAMITGCAVLSSPDPVPLFRFGQSAAPDALASAPAVSVLLSGVVFNRAAGADRILTVTGPEVSYIGGSRWAAPAVGLFEEAVLRAFQGSAVRLFRRGNTARADAVLRLDVRTFEARYATPESMPTVVVETRALLTPLTGEGETFDAFFAAERSPGVNRVAAIAQAFDSATADVLGRLVGWTRSSVRPAVRG